MGRPEPRSSRGAEGEAELSAAAADSVAVVKREFARTRRNRIVVTSVVLALGSLVIVLPDVQGGSLGISSVIFLGILGGSVLPHLG